MADNEQAITLRIEASDSVSVHQAEAWAVGQRGGVDVPDTDETYHNNARSEARRAGGEARSPGAPAHCTRNGQPVESGDPAYHKSGKYYSDQMAAAVEEVTRQAVVEAAGNAEAWAVGQRRGADVPSTDPAYHNNAKYYAEQTHEELESVAERVEAARDETVAAAGTFDSGLRFLGSVNYAADLPAGATLGDKYLVLYAGSTGTNYIGKQYVWDGTAWRPIGNDLKLYRDADGDLCEED